MMSIAKSHKIKRKKSSYKLEISADSSTRDTAINFYISASFRFDLFPPRYNSQLTNSDTDSDEPKLSKTEQPHFLLSILPANGVLARKDMLPGSLIFLLEVVLKES